MRLVRALPILLAAAWACNRVEEPQSSPGPHKPEAAVTAAEAPPPTTPPPAPAPERCLAPMPKEPAPPAPRATTCPEDPTGPLELPRGTVTFTEAPGRPKVEVELARDDPSRTRGLMYRTSMPEDHGMLFSWDDERIRSFWMRNTCLPLDMLFIAKDGTIVGILEQVPTLNLAPRQVPCPAAHVLELNAGYARRHGVAVGTKVQIQG